MIAFVVTAAVLVAVALLFVLPPLLGARRGTRGVTRDAINITVYRDQLRELDADLKAGTIGQDRYDEARREIERGLLEDANAEAAAPMTPVARSRATAIVVAVAVPVLAGGLYLLTGTPGALNPERLAHEDAHGLDRQQIEAMVEQLAQKLRASPDPNPEGWLMLGRSYNAMGRYAEAVDAYRHALKAGPPDARVLADLADALAMAQGRTLQGEPEKLIQQALKIDPHNVKALALAGTAAYDRKDYRSAVDYWQRIQEIVPPDSEMGRSIGDSIAEARSLGGIKADAKPQAKVAATGAGHVSGEVRIAPSLASRISPSDTLFIFAQAANGPPMPLAILRKQASDLPARFALDDSMAMTPQAKLSSFPNVVVSARVSKSGNAMPQPGDLEGRTQPIKVGAADAVVLIDHVVP
jgi:cytochrome c-type biogenesis protein CcmH